MNILPYCLGLLLLASCNTPAGKSGVPLFNNLVFTLQAGEQLWPADERTLAVFSQYAANDSLDMQLPLFKYIRHPAYEVFIALPVGADLQTLFQRRAHSAKAVSTPADYYDTWAQEGLQVTEYAFRRDKHLFFILVLARSPDLEDRFSQSALAKRIQ